MVRTTIPKEDIIAKIQDLGYAILDAFDNTMTYVNFRCVQGHTWKTKTYNVYSEMSGCPECTRPSSEASTMFIMETILDKRFKKTRQVLPSKLELDGYNEELKLAIEYNGGQHYFHVPHFHREEGSFKAQQKRDVQKREECKKLSIELITVHYKKDTLNKIQEYIESELLRLGYDINENLNWDDLKANFRKNYDPILDAFKGIKELVEEKNGICLSTNYIDRLDPMRFKCEVAEHPEFEKTPADIRRNVWCNQCAHDAPLDDIMSRLTLDDNGNIPNCKDRMYTIRVRIEEHLESGRISESMVPLINGVPCPTEAMLDLLATLDPCGTGSDKARVKINKIIHGHMPCCRLLSYFGKTDDDQLVICLNTLLIFNRMRDSCKLVDRKCPLCVFDRDEDASRRKIGYEDPWASIPVYTYNHACKNKKNPEPLKYITKFLTVGDILEPKDKVTVAHVMKVVKPLRYSVFKCSNGFLAKTTIPKRAKCQEMYVSFYPPVDNRMSEENPNWILARRMSCAIITFMHEYYQPKYIEEKERDRAKAAAKKAAKIDVSSN